MGGLLTANDGISLGNDSTLTVGTTSIDKNSGDLSVGGDTDVAGDLDVSGDTVMAGLTVNEEFHDLSPSDRRIKTNIEPVDSQVVLDRITSLSAVRYEWIDPDTRKPGTQFGFIAQDVEAVFPEWIVSLTPKETDSQYIGDDEHIKGIRYSKEWTFYLIEAIKALKAENEMLKQRLDSIESQL